MSKQSNIYFVEVTDTYAGEANYSWVHRFKVKASSEIGAIRKVGKYIGVNFRKDYSTGDMMRYSSKSKCSCAFVDEYNALCHDSYSNVAEL